MTTQPSRTESDLPPALVLAFAPVHKLNFGLACGSTGALLVVALTVVHLVRSPDDPYPLNLLSEFFYGYSITLTGAVVGGFWAGLAGFVAGWFLAFSRNLAIAVTIFLVRTRAALAANRDFLDHI